MKYQASRQNIRNKRHDHLGLDAVLNIIWKTNGGKNPPFCLYNYVKLISTDFNSAFYLLPELNWNIANMYIDLSGLILWHPEPVFFRTGLVRKIHRRSFNLVFFIWRSFGAFTAFFPFEFKISHVVYIYTLNISALIVILYGIRHAVFYPVNCFIVHWLV